MNQSVSALGSVFRATRKSKNLSQEALVEKLGVCKRTIMDIEKNENFFSVYEEELNHEEKNNRFHEEIM